MAGKGKSRDDFLDKMNEKLEKGEELVRSIAANSAKITAETEKTAGNVAKIKLTPLQKAFESLSKNAQEGIKQIFGKDWDKNIKSVQALKKALESLPKDKKQDWVDFDEVADDVKKLDSIIAKQKKNTGSATKDQKQFNDQLAKTVATLEKVSEVYEKLNQAIEKGGIMRVRVDNAGFQSIVTEMANAIERFNGRVGNEGKNFFDVEGIRKAAQGDEPELAEIISNTVENASKKFDSDEIKKHISDAVSKAIKEGVVSGIKLGTAEGFSGLGAEAVLNDIAKIEGMLTDKGVKPSNINYTIEKLLGDEPLTAKQVESIQKKKNRDKAYADAESKKEIQLAKMVEETKREEQDNTHRERMHQINAEAEAEQRRQILSNNPEAAAKIAKNLVSVDNAAARDARAQAKSNKAIYEEKAEQARIATELMYLELEKGQNEQQKSRDWTSRKEAVMMDFLQTEKQLEEELARNAGRELTEVDKALQKMDELVAKRHDLEMQARDGVRNTSQQVKNYHDMVKQVQQIAQEQYKLDIGYEKQTKALTKAVEQYQKMDRYLQAMGNTIAGATRLWDQMGSMVQNTFNRFRNGIMSLFYTGRSELQTLVTEATEQYGKLERAQIGFGNFFGQDKAKQLVTRIQQEAIAAPSLSAGDLADYVAQLAPVSGGNADLALNATMGVLKAIQYSGSEASTEMWRVVTNIRDVMSKGAATTIDIRQFNKAMPAMEKALEEIGASEFLKNGQLKITKENAKQIVEMFARLNTDPESPVKNIFKQMGNTLEGLREAWKERRTQMVMNVLKDSGAFDLMKGLLTDASNSSVLYKVQDFFTQKIKSIIDWLKTVDWDRLGETVSDGFNKIKEGFSEAYDIIAKSLPGDANGWEMLATVFESIKRIITGFASGVSTTVKTLNNMFGGIDAGLVENAASVVGFMLSPVQKLFSGIGHIATSVLSTSQNINKTLGQFGQTRLRNYQAAVEKAAEMQATMATTWIDSAESLKNISKLKAIPNSDLYTKTIGTGANKITKTGYVNAGMFIEQDYYEKMKKAGVFKTEVKDALAQSRYGQNLDQLSYSQIARVNMDYYGGKISNVWQRTLNAFTTQIGKIVNGGQLLAFGTGIKAMADKTNTAVQMMGAAVQALGVFSAGRGLGGIVGGIFGNQKIGSMVGGILGAVTGIATILNSWWESERAKREQEALDRREEAENTHVALIRDKVMEALGIDPDATESGKYVYNELTKRLNEEEIKDLIGQGKYGDLNGVLKEFSVFAQSELNRYHRSDFLEKIDDFKNKDESEMTDEAKMFHALTGKVYSNWGDDASAEEQEVRKFIADMVREHGLLSDSQVGGLLSKASDQKIVETFLDDFNGTINEGQVNYLRQQVEEANKLFPSDLEAIATNLKTNETAQDKLRESIDALNNSAKYFIEKDKEVSKNTDEQMDKTTMSDDALAINRAGLSSGLEGSELEKMVGKFRIGIGEALSEITGDMHSLGFKYFKNDLGLWDNMTQEVTKVQNGTIGGYTPAPNTIAGNTWDEIKNSPAIKNLGDRDLFSFLDLQLQALATNAQANNNTEMLENVGKIYRYIEEQGSYVGLSAEETQKKMMNLLMYIKMLLPGFFEFDVGSWARQSPTSNMRSLQNSLYGFLPGFHAAGGKIGRGVDTVPAFLQPGEFVMRRGSVMKAGLGVMSALNRGDLAAAARGLGSKLITGGEFNNSRNWSNITNNNQRTNNNVFNIVNRNMSARTNTYHSLANRIATA